jgi:aryl-alcohol dehydrogenase-like predicted oxidoreductase
LGCTGLVSSAIGLGGFGFGGAYGKADPAAAVRTIRAALDMGMTLLDAADFKAGGRVESLIGRALGRRRDDAVISARGGLRPMRSGSLIDCSPAFLTTGCHSALRRLRTGDIDLYYLAGADQKVPIEDSVGAIADLVKAGLVRHIGVSVSTAAELRRAHAVHPVTAVVAEYSLLARHAERELLPAADELGVGFIACGPLGRGFLTGRLCSRSQLERSDIRRDHPWFHEPNAGQHARAIRAAEKMAAGRDIGMSRLALAWVLSRGAGIVPVAGTRSPVHAELNAAAVSARLTPLESEKLAAHFPAKPL